MDTSAPTQQYSPNTPGAGSVLPTVLPAGNPVPGSDRSFYSYPTDGQEMTPPPPPPVVSTFNPYGNSTPGAPSYPQTPSAPSYPQQKPAYNQPPAALPQSGVPSAGSYVVPAYAQKPKRGRGCLITSIVLLLILVAGIAGFIFLKSRTTPTSTTHTNTTAPTTAPGTGTTPQSGTTPSAPAATTEPLNLKITYAGVNFTIISAQEASNFTDDTSTNPPIAVRINLHETNASPSNAIYAEYEVVLLLLPDGSSVQSSNQLYSTSPAAGVSRTNWIDFSLTKQVTLSQLVLRLGTAQENQMDVPLHSTADLSKYQDKTISPNTAFIYDGLNWTLKTATRSYCYSATSKQASANNAYIIMTFAVVNNTADNVSIYPGDSMRLQAGATSQTPDSTYSLPTQFAAHTTSSGTIAFLMPQTATSFTLVMEADATTNPPIAQTTETFQIV